MAPSSEVGEVGQLIAADKHEVKVTVSALGLFALSDAVWGRIWGGINGLWLGGVRTATRRLLWGGDGGRRGGRVGGGGCRCDDGRVR